MPPFNPSQTRAFLDQLDHRAKKKLGQNFLIDANIVRKSIELAELNAGDNIVEIGPGLGTLTGTLLDQKCKVYAVELDKKLAQHIRAQFSKSLDKQLFFLEGDAVDHPIGRFNKDDEDFSIVANLPYAITSPWIDGVLQGFLPKRMVLMMQKEAAQRLSAKPGSGQISAVSIFLQAAYEETQSHRVSKSCFYPEPGVDSILVRYDLKPNPFKFSTEQKLLIRKLFTQRRKQIGTLLKNHPGAENWLENLSEWNCSQKSRPEQIPLEAWMNLH